MQERSTKDLTLSLLAQEMTETSNLNQAKRVTFKSSNKHYAKYHELHFILIDLWQAQRLVTAYRGWPQANKLYYIDDHLAVCWYPSLEAEQDHPDRP